MYRIKPQNGERLQGKLHVYMLEVMLFDKNNVDFKSIQHSWHPRLFELEN